MPVYPGNNLATLLYEGYQGQLFVAETLITGVSSIAFRLRRERGSSYPWGAAFQLAFSAAPGAFGVDIQVAETDTDASYVTVDSITAVNTGFTARYDMLSVYPSYVRARVTAAPANAVLASMLVTR